MSDRAYALFETALGAGGIVWSGRGVVGVELPRSDSQAARGRLTRRFPGVVEALPPPTIARAIESIVALLAGDLRDLSDIVLDQTGVPAFDSRVLAVTRSIPPGETLTYGQIAARLGEPRAAQAVGRALGANSTPIIVPCHRVVGANGKVGGFSAPGGVAAKARLLSIEKASTGPEPLLFDTLPITVRTDRR